MKLYHADMGGEITPGEPVELSQKVPPVQYVAPEWIATVTETYPDGLSKYGQNLLYRPDLRGSPNLVNDCVNELYRVHHYPEKPSRFQSIFACETVNELKRFVRRHHEGEFEYDIYEIDVSDCSGPHNMGFLGVSSLAHGLNFAEKYWNGENHEDVNEYLIEFPVTFDEPIEKTKRTG